MKTMKQILVAAVICHTLLHSNLISQTQGSGVMDNTAFPAAGGNGTNRTFIGSGAGFNNQTSGIDNSFIGEDAGYNNQNQTENTFVGARAGYSNGIGDNQSKASQNVFVGCDAGYSNGNGGNNTFVGFKAGYNNVSALANSYFGVYAGRAGTGSSDSLPDSRNLPVQTIALSQSNAILYQNNPNPVTDKTQIHYFLPENASNAEMIFFNQFGQEIGRTTLTNKGNAVLDVDVLSISAGVYTYSMIVDGRVIDTKQFIRAR
jgi:hypothetical protein